MQFRSASFAKATCASPKYCLIKEEADHLLYGDFCQNLEIRKQG
jgi:hypothetical protein